MSKTSEKLALQVSNFGPIAEGRSIELRPLTVFLGPSNTGKSYLATLINALLDFFSKQGIYGGSASYKQYWVPLSKYLPESSISNEQLKILIDWASDYQKKMLNQHLNSDLIGKTLPDQISNLVRKLLDHAVNDEWKEFISRNIATNFDTDKIGLLNRRGGAEDAQIRLIRRVGNDDFFKLNIDINDDGIDSSATILEKLPVQFLPIPLLSNFIDELVGPLNFSTHSDEVGVYKNTHRQMVNVILGLAISTLLYSAGENGASSVHYIPASRSGLMAAQRIVTIAVMQSHTIPIDPSMSRLPMLPNSVQSFLNTFLTLDENSSPGPLAEIADRLEQATLGGRIILNEKKYSPMQLIPTVSYRPNGWENGLPMINSSSMVSEIAPLVLYLRHVVQEGDTLIIEEPEAHLHPAMQAAVIKELVRAVHAGVRIIITTHSEWIVEALENIALTSKLPEDKRGDVSLKPEDLGVWTFQHEKEGGGSIVRELPFDPEIGFDTEDYSRVAADLHNQWADISSEIERNETR